MLFPEAINQYEWLIPQHKKGVYETSGFLNAGL